MGDGFQMPIDSTPSARSSGTPSSAKDARSFTEVLGRCQAFARNCNVTCTSDKLQSKVSSLEENILGGLELAPSFMARKSSKPQVEL
eukprot:scaffold2679_cov251-Pinguiococcus_pyrenoidosus.AAC.6